MEEVKRRKLSHSAVTTYLACPASFDYRYNHGIRQIKSGSPLIFGSAIDEALNALLLKTEPPMVAYVKAMDKVALGKMIPSVYDYDPELLDEEETAVLLSNAQHLGYKGDDIHGLAKTLLSAIKDGEEISEKQFVVADMIARRSLQMKASIMIDAYRKQVLPEIEIVHNCQKPSGPGFLDATVTWRGRGKIIVDHKTSSRAYPENAVEYSAQLAMYCAEEKINQVAFVVLIKQLKKNRIKMCSSCGENGTGKRHKTCYVCKGEWIETISPEAEMQVVHGEVTDRAIEIAAEAQSEIQRAVDAKIFPCNLPKCNDQYGKPCAFRDLKWKGSMDGLEVMKSRSKK